MTWSLDIPLHILSHLSKCQVLVHFGVPTHLRFKNRACKIWCWGLRKGQHQNYGQGIGSARTRVKGFFYMFFAFFTKYTGIRKKIIWAKEPPRLVKKMFLRIFFFFDFCVRKSRFSIFFFHLKIPIKWMDFSMGEKKNKKISRQISP